ncbi:hypothetical protein ACROYT_G004882 [Oculina patagonica]
MKIPDTDTGPETTDSEPVKSENDWEPQGDSTESGATEEIENDEVSEESSQQNISIDPEHQNMMNLNSLYFIECI